MKGANKGEVVAGENDQGLQNHQLSGPASTSLNKQSNLSVINVNNARVQRFDVQ